MRSILKKYLRRPSGSNYAWYVLYSGKASIGGIESLFQSLGVPYAIWLPSYRVCRINKNDVIATDKKAFPGYVFASFLNQEPTEYQEQQSWLVGIESQIKGQDAQFKFLRSPAGIVGNGSIPGFQEKDLFAMDGAIQELSAQAVVETPFQVNDFVRIISGPFAGTVGQVESMQAKKVFLRVFFLSKQVRMEISATHLQFLATKQ